MREILFRGRTTRDKEWVYGDLLNDGYDYDVAIWEKEYKLVTEVSIETVGQFTGLTDKNGKKIFEGDILEWDLAEYGRGYRERVNWSYGLFSMRQSDWREWCEVIGNIHDNPELLEVDNA